MISDLKDLIFELLLPLFLTFFVIIIIIFMFVKLFQQAIYDDKLEALEQEYRQKKCELYNGIYTNKMCVKEDNFINID